MSLLHELSANIVGGSTFGGVFNNVTVENTTTLNGEVELEGEAVSSVPPTGVIDKWLVVTTDDTEYKLPLAQSEQVIVPIVTTNFVPSEYNEVQGFLPVGTTFNVADKNYFYNSTLATTPTSSLFNVGITNTAGVDATTIVPWDTLYPPFFYPRPDPVVLSNTQQVPGPYPYGPVVAANQYPQSAGVVPPPLAPGDNSGSWGWPQWGGDTTLDFGPHFYSSTISHFGHTHILNLQSKALVLRANSTADTTVQDLMSEHLIVASTEIFARFALLIDYANASVVIPHNSSNLENDIAQACTVYIYGTPFPGNVSSPGVLDTDFLIGTMNFWATNPAYGNGDATLLSYVQGVTDAWDYLLFKNVAGKDPLDLLAWYQLITMHQHDMFSTFLKYRAYFADPTNETIKAELNEQCEMDLNGGRQLAAFFIGFYYIVNFWDRLATILGNPSPSANPNVAQRLPFVKWGQARYWSEHVAMFNDFSKAAAKNDNQTVFKVQVNMLESCASLGISIGEIFRAFDDLNRKRDAYSTWAATVGPHANGFPLGV